jgi:hypothetical protein
MGGGKHCDAPPPPVSLLRCSDSCGGGAGVTSETTDNKQTTIKSWQRVAFDKGGSILRPYHHPPKRHNLPLGWGEGVAGFDMAQKGRAGDAIIMRWTMMTTKMAWGGSKRKSINDSISEHKCIVTSNIIYSISIIIPINSNCTISLFL